MRKKFRKTKYKFIKKRPVFISILVFLSISVFILLMMSIGCGTIASEDPGGIKLKKITVILDWVPNTNHTGVYVARENGYYDEEGLEVEIIQPSEGGSADLIAAGKGDFGFSYQEQVTYARTAAEPLPVVVIAAVIQHNTSGFASPAGKNIKSPADFEGKKYGGWGSPMEEAMLKGLMEKYGADFEKVEIVNIGASDFFTSVSKDVDFAWIFYGWDGVAAEIKDFPLDFLLLQDLDPRLDFYTPVLIASEATIMDEPRLVKSFLAATEKGYLYSIENPKKAAEILTENVPEIDRELAIASQEYLSTKYIDDTGNWGFMQEKIWTNFSDWMYENGLLPERLDAVAAFTNDFLQD